MATKKNSFSTTKPLRRESAKRVHTIGPEPKSSHWGGKTYRVSGPMKLKAAKNPLVKRNPKKRVSGK